MPGAIKYIRKPNALSPPQSVAASIVDATSLRVSWELKYQPRYPVTSFEIIRNPGNITTTISDPSTLSSTFTGLTAGTAYTFQVRSITATRNSSYAQVSKTIPVGVNYAPINVTVAPTSTDPRNVTVSWGVSSGGQCDYYVVTNLTTGQSTAQLAATTRSTTFTALTLGASYTYRISGFIGVANEWFETESSIYIAAIAPTAAGKITATPIGDGAMRLTFAAPTSNGVNNLGNNTYEIRHNRSSEVIKTVVAPAGQSVTTDVDGLNRGTSYAFICVRVTNDYGKTTTATSSWSSGVYTWNVPYQPTLTAYDLSLAGDTLGTIKLNWAAYYPTWNTATTSYKLSAVPALPQGIITLGGGAGSTTTLTGLDKSATYTFSIYGVNSIGNSTVRTATKVAASVPPAPYLDNLEEPRFTYYAGAIVGLKLPAVYDDGGAAVTSYYIKWQNSGGGWSGPYSTAYPDADGIYKTGGGYLSAGSVYNFYIALTNSKGVGEYSYYGEVVAASVPITVTSVSLASYTETTMDVSWVRAGDGGHPIDGWRLTISPVPAGYASGTIEYNGANGDVYQFTGLTTNTSYTINVAAHNDVGYGPNRSAAGYVRGIPATPTYPTAQVTTALNTTYGEGTVSLRIPAWPTSHGSALFQYEIYDSYTNESILANQYWHPFNEPVPAASTYLYIQRGIRQVGQGGTFKIRFQNESGWSAWSANSASVIPFGRPDVPVIGTTAHYSGSGYITCYFTPGANNGSSYTNYSIMRAYNTATGVSSTGNVAAANTGTQTNGSVTSLTNGITYDMYVKTQNSQGFSEESYLGSLIPSTVPANAVITQAAVQSDTQAYIEWTIANDGGTPITSIEVTTSPALPTSLYAGSKCILGEYDRAVQLEGLTPNTSYTVYVQAFNMRGANGKISKVFTGLSTSYTYGIPATPSNPTCAATTAANYAAHGAGAISITVPTYTTSRGSAIDYYEVMDIRTGETIYSYYNEAAGTVQWYNRPIGYAATYKVRFHNGYGWSAWSTAGNSVMAASVPGAATGATFTSITKTSYTITATYSNSNLDITHGAVISYVKWVRSDGGVDTGWYGNNAKSFSGMTAGTNYGWYIYLKNVIGESSEYVYVEQATLP